MNRRQFLKTITVSAASLTLSPRLFANNAPAPRPNILLCISDDQSWLHTGAYGDKVVKTPNFDRIAKDGVMFTNAFCAAPSCTPSRGAILTGQHIWRLRQGANLWSTLPAELPVYTDLLAQAGYHLGYMGKGWGPGKIEPGGRKHNPAGTKRYESFSQFLETVPKDKPFCFWFGSKDPHRPYELGAGKAEGMKPEDVLVPPVWPDVPQVKSDICDYYKEVQRFDSDLGNMLKLLKQTGQLGNTLITVTSDNGMPFPRAKATLYDLGTRVPLAIRWPSHIPAGRVVDDLVSLTDLAPTFLEAAGLKVPDCMTGRTLMNIITSKKSGQIDPERTQVFTALERHGWVRKDGMGYPARAIRTRRFLYIRNYESDRWPAGDPPLYGDIDCHDLHYYAPTKEYMMQHRNDINVRKLFKLAFEKRSAEELYDLAKDPHQINNLADKPNYSDTRKKLAAQLEAYLKKTADPRATGQMPMWDTWPYYGGKKNNPRKDAPIEITGISFEQH